MPRMTSPKRLIRALTAAAFALIFAAGVVAGGRWQEPVRAQGFSVTMECGTLSAAKIRTTLYFGLSRPKGSVSELEWQVFLRDEVTRRFPDGLTVWQAEGQWLSHCRQHRSRAVEGVAAGSSRYRSGAAVGARGHPDVPQVVRTGIGALGKLARLHRVVGRHEQVQSTNGFKARVGSRRRTGLLLAPITIVRHWNAGDSPVSQRDVVRPVEYQWSIHDHERR